MQESGLGRGLRVTEKREPEWAPEAVRPQTRSDSWKEGGGRDLGAREPRAATRLPERPAPPRRSSCPCQGTLAPARTPSPEALWLQATNLFSIRRGGGRGKPAWLLKAVIHTF